MFGFTADPPPFFDDVQNSVLFFFNLEKDKILKLAKKGALEIKKKWGKQGKRIKGGKKENNENMGITENGEIVKI